MQPGPTPSPALGTEEPPSSDTGWGQSSPGAGDSTWTQTSPHGQTTANFLCSTHLPHPLWSINIMFQVPTDLMQERLAVVTAVWRPFSFPGKLKKLLSKGLHFSLALCPGGIMSIGMLKYFYFSRKKRLKIHWDFGKYFMLWKR